MQAGSQVVTAFYNALSSLLSPAISSPDVLGGVSLLLALVLAAAIIAVLFTLFTLVFAWIERKLVARAQSRHGPTYVGSHGILQNVADLFKLMAKENIVPDNADKPLFQAVLPALTALFIVLLAFIPITGAFVGIDSSLGMLAIFVLLSFSPLLLFLAGWTSGNKYASISAQRSVVMLVGYEIPLLLVVVAVSAFAGGYGMSAIVASQQRYWLALLMPLGFVVFFVVLLAEMERPPFDLREADSELIAGWLTDVGAPYYGLALLLDYTRILVGSLLVSELFLGGWGGTGNLPPFAVLMAKVAVVALAVIVIRATTVRMKLNRILRLGWVYLTPLAVANLLITFALFVR